MGISDEITLWLPAVDLDGHFVVSNDEYYLETKTAELYSDIEMRLRKYLIKIGDPTLLSQTGIRSKTTNNTKLGSAILNLK